ncbi:LuxR family transcriptional regulator, partial [Microbacterium oxydans]|uniref:response regulator transcription factor n=1 Tax=Microbacterium oxydans TaxID=82380 RepID=UPI00079A8EC8
MTINVLIADDQAMVRAGFGALLDAHDGIRVAGQAGDGEDAVTLVARRAPDVGQLDLRMPGLADKEDK